MYTVNDGISARGAYLKNFTGAAYSAVAVNSAGALIKFWVATVLSAEILKIKNKYTHFELANFKIISCISCILVYIDIHIQNKICSFFS